MRACAWVKCSDIFDRGTIAKVRTYFIRIAQTYVPPFMGRPLWIFRFTVLSISDLKACESHSVSVLEKTERITRLFQCKSIRAGTPMLRHASRPNSWF